MLNEPVGPLLRIRYAVDGLSAFVDDLINLGNIAFAKFLIAHAGDEHHIVGHIAAVDMSLRDVGEELLQHPDVIVWRCARLSLELVRAAGHDVMTVKDQGLAGTADESLFQVCAAEARALITLDHDFGTRLLPETRAKQ